MADDTLAERIFGFVRNAGSADFEGLSLELFARQYETLPAYRRHCETLGVSPTTVGHWSEIPAIAAEDATEPDAWRESEEFSSSSPTLAQGLFRSALPELFDPLRLQLLVGAVEGPSAGARLLGTLGRDAPQGSLVSGARLDAKALRSWLGARQRDRRPVSLVSDPAGFARLLGVLERRAVKFRLPPGSEAFCVLAFGATASAPKDSWSRPLLAGLGLPAESCLRVFAGPRASTPLLEHVSGSDRGVRLPHWVRTAPVAGGSLALFDLASIDAPPRRLPASSDLRFS